VLSRGRILRIDLFHNIVLIVFWHDRRESMVGVSSLRNVSSSYEGRGLSLGKGVAIVVLQLGWLDFLCASLR